MLATISATLEPSQSNELFEQIDDDEDFYTSTNGSAYHDDDEFTDDETADADQDESKSTKSFDEGYEDSNIPTKSPHDAESSSSAASVSLAAAAMLPPMVPTTSESAEVETVLPPLMKQRVCRSNSTMPLCTCMLLVHLTPVYAE